MTSARGASMVLAVTCAAMAAPSVSADQRCPPSWVPALVGGPPNQLVLKLMVVEDGDDARLYVTGPFTEIGGVAVEHFAEWTGQGWRAVPIEITSDGTPLAVASLDNGAGPTTYVGGSFSSVGGTLVDHIVRWDGERWREVGGGVDGPVTEMVSGELAGSPVIVASGAFQNAGGVPAERIAQWDGSSWSALDAGLDAPAASLVVADLGDGAALYAAGSFTASGEAGLNHVGRWDGSTWTALGAGLDAPARDAVSADLGDGPKLYVVGDFTSADGAAASHVACWDGRSWSALGEGLPSANRVAAVDFGKGARLFVRGTVEREGPESLVSISTIFAWDGSDWAVVAEAEGGSIQDIAALEDVGGPRLVACGSFTAISGVPIERIAFFDGVEWTSATPERSGLEAPFSVYGSFARVEGHLNVVYLGGAMGTEFTSSQACVKRVSWPLGADGNANELSMVDLGPLPEGFVTDFVEHDDGSGVALYASGRFVDPETGEWHGLARVDGNRLTVLPSRLDGGSQRDFFDLVSFDDGAGTALYVGGRFSAVEGVPAANVACWRNGSWSALGEGVPGQVFALHVHDDGVSSALYVGADPWGLGIDTAVPVLRWNGAAWEALEESASDALLTGGSVFALATHDDGDGPALYAGRYGEGGVWRWTGGNAGNDGTWISLGNGLSGSVHSLVSHDDGSGLRLYAGGSFVVSGPPPSAWGVARWDGRTWSPVGHGVASISSGAFLNGVITLSSVPDSVGGKPALLVAGKFVGALDAIGAGVAAVNAAIWGDGGAPVVVEHPRSVAVAEGGAATFQASFFTKWSAGEVRIRWRQDGVELVDGPRAGGEVVGAETSMLTIVGVSSADEGLYDVVVANDCGDGTSEAALLTIGCLGDIDGDGAVGGDDLGALLAAWGASAGPADLDGDGTVGAGDLAALFASWGCAAAPAR